MPSISYDGQSLIIGGHRVWLVSGSIQYARVPHQLWRQRIRAAKQAGLNCIRTCVFWNYHERNPGEFDFEGDRDIRRFIEIVAEEGMSCVLCPGPYVGARWDMGGLPPWLLNVPGMALRENNGPFKEACARYISALLAQVSDLQATSTSARVGPGADSGFGGYPIVMMQIENHWQCDEPTKPRSYLTELTRFLREHGCTVPISECNNLWASTDGVIPCWSGADLLTGDLRQLHLVRPETPRIVAEFPCGEPDRWGKRLGGGTGPDRLLYRLAGILAAGAQYNTDPFYAGTNFAFSAGRGIGDTSDFFATSFGEGALLGEAGTRGPHYAALKRISVFASQFAQLFAHLDPDDHHPCVALTEGEHALSVIRQRGSQGRVVFLFRGDGDRKGETADVLLPNGITLPVPLGSDPVTWFLFDADLSGVARLTYTNLRPWAFLGGRLLVVFGPAGAAGQVCINDSTLFIDVPKGRTPAVEHHDPVTVVVLNEQQVDAALLSPDGLLIGADGLDEQDRPIELAGWSRATVIDHDGKVRRRTPVERARTTPPKLTGWQQARLGDVLDGSSPAYEAIDGPASLEALGHGSGYGWYRVSNKAAAAGPMVIAPESGDRLHLYRDGKLSDLLGEGPGATDGATKLDLSGDTVILADNLGRYSLGWQMGESKGLFGHFYAVESIKLGKPKTVPVGDADLFKLREFFPEARQTERPIARALSWTVRPKGKQPLIIEFDHLPARVLLLVNDQPVAAYDPIQSAGFARFVLHSDSETAALKAGNNQLTLAIYDPSPDPPLAAIAKGVSVHHATANLTKSARWSFAPWSMPDEKAFRRLTKSAERKPIWFRCSFKLAAADAPVWLVPEGMSKGQVFINGHNAGRYFVATHTGKSVAPQTRYYLPEPWLCTDRPNELLLFDEHGRPPTKCRLVTVPGDPA